MNLGRNLGYGFLGLPYDVKTGFADHIDVNSRSGGQINSDPVRMQSLVFATYLAVGTTDLTGKLYNLQKSGFWQKIKDVPIPGSLKTIKIHQGAEPAGYSFGVLWGSDRNAAADFLDYLRNIAIGSHFYNRDSLWYHKIYIGDSSPNPLQQTGIWQPDFKIYLTDQYLYSEIHQDWGVIAGTLPQVSDSIDNYGHLADGFESIAITGHYSSPNHVEDLVLSVAGGNSMTLSDHLLQDEKITLGVDGSLITEWTALLTSLATFQRDATTSGTVTFSGDHIAIAASSSANISLSGPWPTKKAVKVTANLTITGTASVQISTDAGATYIDAITTANIDSGVSAIYYLTGSIKVADMRIKFNCPTASTMLIHSLKIERELDCSGADLPMVQPASQAVFTVSCDVTKSTTATVDATYHPRRYPT